MKWLDLRHNKLLVIPGIYLRNHQNLRTILIEGNQLRTLPLEFGNCSYINFLFVLFNMAMVMQSFTGITGV